jgi:septum formation protein
MLLSYISRCFFFSLSLFPCLFKVDFSWSSFSSCLKSLSNATHEVITSVCFKTIAKTETIFEVTKVTFNTLSDDSIRYYLDNYKPFDKAGAYGIQDWIGLIGISKIEGSYTNVVGLPTEKVYYYLTQSFL